MGYQIEYRDGSVIWKSESVCWSRVVLFSVIVFLLFTIFSINFWPEGGEILQSWLYPGNVEDTKTALQHIASSLSAGGSVSDAVYVFCQEILTGAANSG